MNKILTEFVDLNTKYIFLIAIKNIFTYKNVLNFKTIITSNYSKGKAFWNKNKCLFPQVILRGKCFGIKTDGCSHG